MGIVAISLGLLMPPAVKPSGPNQPPVAKPNVEFVRYDYQGTVTEVTDKSITIQEPGFDPKRFPASGPLAGGKYGQRLGYPSMYRLADIRVGDKVDIFCERINGVYYCTHICILGRPGGKIPPSPGEPADIIYKWHERRQAYQDWEEKGIPIPDKYHPGGPEAGIAPAPRELKPRIPPAKQ
jgi:hypothetical protein